MSDCEFLLYHCPYCFESNLNDLQLIAHIENIHGNCVGHCPICRHKNNDQQQKPQMFLNLLDHLKTFHLKNQDKENAELQYQQEFDEIQRTFQQKQIKYDPNLIKSSLLRQNGNQNQALQELTGCSAPKPFYQRMESFKPNPKILVQELAREKDTRTTIIIKNIPKQCTFRELEQAVNESFKNQYDLLKMPVDENKANLGFAFINFK